MEPNDLKPLLFGTKCEAKNSFTAEEKGDLSFTRGDKLTILGPCDVLFWYFAKDDATGELGRIPATDDFLRVVSLQEVDSEEEDSHDYEDVTQMTEMEAGPGGSAEGIEFIPNGTMVSLKVEVMAQGKKIPRGVRLKVVEHDKMSKMYVGETSSGDVIMIPLNAVEYLERPPMPTPSEANEDSQLQKKAIYKKFETFMRKSGWFTHGGKTGQAQLLHVLASKAHMRFQDIIKVEECLFTFSYSSSTSRACKAMRFIDQTTNFVADMNGIFTSPYEAGISDLNPFQKQLLFIAPDSKFWSFSIETIPNKDCLSLELAKRIVERRSLQGGQGFNERLEFTPADWSRFKSWYASRHRNRPIPK